MPPNVDPKTPAHSGLICPYCKTTITHDDLYADLKWTGGVFNDAIELIAVVAEEYHVKPHHIRADIRSQAIHRARKAAMLRVRKELGLSITEIGKVFNRTPGAVSRAFLRWGTRAAEANADLDIPEMGE